jgi:broad specificity phosphatase PhoE
LRHPITPLRCGHGPTPTASPPARRSLIANALWARHGQNVANLTETFSHRVFDGDLTDAGRRQAHELADRLAVGDGEPVAYLVCSPLRRARQTADIVGQRLGLPVAWSSTICGSSM